MIVLPRRSDTLVRVIGGLKLLKASVLLALGVCGLSTSGVELGRLPKASNFRRPRASKERD
ncbi:MAG: hypothetical protein ABIS92_07890 [Polyangia bacterium]